MHLSVKCSVAVHCLVFIYEARGAARVTSGMLAESTGCNPVTIRGILSALKKAGIIAVARGTGGAELVRDPGEVTLYDIYTALEPAGVSSLIGIHDCRDRPCPVARNIRSALAGPYARIEGAVRETMEDITLRSMIDDFEAAAIG